MEKSPEHVEGALHRVATKRGAVGHRERRLLELSSEADLPSVVEYGRVLHLGAPQVRSH